MFFTILILSVVLFLINVTWKRYKFAKSLPPGPPAWPIVGNMLQIDQTDPRNTFVDWHKKYGPIFTVWLGINPAIFVTGFDLIQQLFVKRGDEFTNRPYTFLLEVFTKGKYGIVNAAGEQWREQRRFSLHTLRNFGVGRKLMEEKIEAETQKLIQSLNDQLGNCETKNLNMRNDIGVCVSNIISSVGMGRIHSSDDPFFRQLTSSMDESFRLISSTTVQLLNSFPWLRFVPIFGHFGFDNLSKFADDFLGIISEELERHKKELGDQYEANDFTAAYLQEMNRRKNAGEGISYFSEWQLLCILNDIWGAGMETTVTTLRWGILLMMHNPQVQKKVQSEIRKTVGTERFPTMADRPQMPYTTAVIHEIQRFANILPFNLARTVTRDTIICGYKFSPDISIFPMISVPLYDDAIYAEPRAFNPYHFIETDDKTLKNLDHLIPFSVGKRSCLGEGLARMELFLIFTALLQRFSFTFVEDESVPDLKPTISLTLTPAPYNVRIRRENY